MGGLQNTLTNLGVWLGNAVVGAVLIASLTTWLVNRGPDSSAIPANALERAYHFDTVHPVAISNTGNDKSPAQPARGRALASVDDPNTTLRSSSGALKKLRRGRLGRGS